MRKHVALAIATASLILAVAAYYPSAAAFTPAILLSFVAATGAFVTAYFGFVRIAIVTLLVVTATVFISPMFFPSFAEPHVGRVMLGSAIGIAIVGFVLLWNFSRRRASANNESERARGPNARKDRMNRPMQKYAGSCHCGAVRFEVETDFPELTMCDCSLCKRKNALMVKVHESKFTLLAGAESLTEYQFHTKVARHFFCKICGIYPFHRKRVTPDFFGINVHCLHDFDPAGIPIRQAVGAAMP